MDEYGDLPSDKPTKPSSGSGSGSGGSGGGGGGDTAGSGPSQGQTKHGYSYRVLLADYSNEGYESKEAAGQAGAAALSNTIRAYKENLIVHGSTEANAQAVASAEETKARKTLKWYKHGGFVDYTGPAWVDGTPTEPEAFLNAYDTKAIQALTEALSYVYVSPGVLPTADMGVSNNTNVGDIYITINQAELKDDADYDEVAKRIGQAFTKQMSKNGLNLSGYAF